MQSPRRPLVVVLGMHRSGTSLCANALAALGVDMAEAASPSPDNPRGHWERARINDLHDQVFAMHGARWSDAGHDLALPPGWWSAPAVAGVQDRIAAYLAPMVASAELAGFKDPRTARLLPMWDPILDLLHASPRFVFCIRNPAQVARSLEARDRTARGQAEYRWLVYNAQAVHGVGNRPICIIPYEDWFASPLATARRLAEWIRPGVPTDEAPLRDLVANVLDSGLRHDPPDDNPVSGDAARRLHAAIMDAQAVDRFPSTLLRMAGDFLDFEQAAAPLLREAIILKTSVADQNRVIGDLESVIRRLRREHQVS